MNRYATSIRRLRALRIAKHEYRQQAYDDWLQVATPGEVRRHYRKWFGSFPGWAVKE